MDRETVVFDNTPKLTQFYQIPIFDGIFLQIFYTALKNILRWTGTDQSEK
jgi:hypothetical protein